MKRALVLLMAAALALASSACSEDNKVGSGVDLNLKDAAGGDRLGARTTTTVAPSETTTPQRAAVTASTSTTVRVTTTPPTTEAPKVATLAVRINSDTGGSTQFDPSQAKVYIGSVVEWTNTDEVPRSVEADTGAFSSGTIQPGGKFTYKAEKLGTFNYHDGTRPYAVGALEVIARS